MVSSDSRKRKILSKLGWACNKIEDLLAGQNLTLADVQLPHERKPGETDLERLQRFKALLSDSLAELNRGAPRTCRVCQARLADDVLDDMPWATACRGCSSAT